MTKKGESDARTSIYFPTISLFMVDVRLSFRDFIIFLHRHMHSFVYGNMKFEGWD